MVTNLLEQLYKMSLPSYADLQKGCKDLFSKGYHFGVFKVITKTKTCKGTEVNTNATHSMEEKTVLADVQTKCNYGSRGLAAAVKWNTDNLLTTEMTCQDYLAAGLKVGVEGRFNLDSGSKGGMVMGQYKIDNATLDMSVEGGDESNLLVNASVVGGYRSYIGGYQLSYDTNDGSLKTNNVAAGFLGSGFTALLTLENMENASGSFYQQVNSNLETSVQGSVKGEDGPMMAVGAKYILNPSGLAIRGKVDNKNKVGVGLEIKAMEGATLFLSSNIDMNDFAAGGHKIGLAVEFS